MRIKSLESRINHFANICTSLAALAGLSLFTPPAYANSVDLGQAYGFGNVNTVGEAILRLTPGAFIIASIAVIFYFLFGAVRLITSGGEKEAVAGARNMITHAIIGLILLLFMFLFLRWLPSVLGLQNYSFF